MTRALLCKNSLDRITGCDAKELTTRDEEQTNSCTRAPSLFCPGVYSPSGVDLMKILSYIATRPNPTVDLGPVDASCALVVCDLSLPDDPIIYVSDAYLALTKYAREEVLGRNCRFLQRPPQAAVHAADGKDRSDSDADQSTFVDPDIRETMRTAVFQNKELRLEVPNFQRDGRLFVNVLTIVPVPSPGNEPAGTREIRPYRYSVGFLCDQATLAQDFC